MLDDEAPFEMSVDISEKTARLVLKGDLDVASAPSLDAQVAAIRPFQVPLIIDVSELLFIDSSGLRSLTAARRAAIEDVGAPVRLTGCRSSLRKLLELTGLEDAFEEA